MTSATAEPGPVPAGGAPGADDLPEVTLPAVPALSGLYLRAARDAVADRLPGGGGHTVGALPAVAYRVTGARVDPERLTAYQHLVGEPAVDALPAGFVHVLAFPVATALMSRPDFPLPLLGMVHLANRVIQSRPLRWDEPLEVRVHADDLRPHHKGTRVDLVATVRGADGTTAWQGVSTYLSPGHHLPGTDRPERPPREDPVLPVPTGRWRYGADRGRRFAAVSGDANPIHLSALSARALGFPRTIAHGMDTAARALATVGAARGDRFTWQVDFAAPVLLPSGPAVSVRPDGAGWVTTVWDAGRGRVHLTGRVDPG